jgi:hypothetical protein
MKLHTELLLSVINDEIDDKIKIINKSIIFISDFVSKMTCDYLLT